MVKEDQQINYTSARQNKASIQVLAILNIGFEMYQKNGRV